MTHWLEIRLPSSPDRLERLAAALSAHGFDSFQVEDSRDFAAYSPHWDMADPALVEHYRDVCRIIVYLPDSPDSLSKLETLGTLCPGLTQQRMAEEDWAENWKQYYTPLPIGKRLLIQPAWLPLDNPDNRAVFWNNPGMTFGTGLHASTRLCLGFLESLSPRRVLDIGCGSGILALCALQLGAEQAAGADIDPLAAAVSRENSAFNKLGDRFEAYAGNVLEDKTLGERLGGGYDLVFSNIVADVIIALAPMIGGFLCPGGHWVVSGIITPRLEDVLRTAAAHGFTALGHESEDGWEALHLRY